MGKRGTILWCASSANRGVIFSSRVRGPDVLISCVQRCKELRGRAKHLMTIKGGWPPQKLHWGAKTSLAPGSWSRWVPICLGPALALHICISMRPVLSNPPQMCFWWRNRSVERATPLCLSLSLSRFKLCTNSPLYSSLVCLKCLALMVRLACWDEHPYLSVSPCLCICMHVWMRVGELLLLLYYSLLDTFHPKVLGQVTTIKTPH